MSPRMDAERFAAELAELIMLATPWLPAQAIREILIDEATAQEGEILKTQLESGPWPPDEKYRGD